MPDPLVSTRVNADLARRLDALARRRGQRRSTVLRELIERGLRASELEEALTAYRAGRVSFGRAVELSGVSVWEFQQELAQRKVGVPRIYTSRDIAEDVAQAEGEP